MQIGWGVVDDLPKDEIGEMKSFDMRDTVQDGRVAKYCWWRLASA